MSSGRLEQRKGEHLTWNLKEPFLCSDFLQIEAFCFGKNEALKTWETDETEKEQKF